MFEQGSYIYLGFKIEGLKGEDMFDPDKYRVEMGVPQMTSLESLAVILAAINGVSKAMVKYRPSGKLGQEYYVFYPNYDSSPHQIIGSITKDYEWPMPW